MLSNVFKRNRHLLQPRLLSALCGKAPRRSASSSASASASTVRCGHIDVALHLDSLRVGQTLEIPYELTVDSSWRDLWHSGFYQHDRVFTSRRFAKSLDFDDIVLPYSMMLFQTASMSHVEDNIEVLDLRFENAVYEHPAYAGDTFHKTFTITGLRPSSDGKKTLVDVRCELFNDFDVCVFSLNKTMLYPQPTSPSQHSVPPENAAKQRGSSFLSHLKRHATSLPKSSTLATLVPGSVVLHVNARPLGTSLSFALSSLTRMTHPTIFNSEKYGAENLIVPHGLALAGTLAASARGLYEVLYENVTQCSFVSKVHPQDVIGALSYVEDIKDFGDNLQELTLVTIGVTGVNVVEQLDERELPVALFDTTLRPKDLRAICEESCPELKDRITVVARRKIVRQSPYSANTFLL